MDFYVELGAKFTNIIFLGDFNIHVLDIESIDGEQFTDMHEALGLQQHDTQPTHTSGHILDHVITEYGNSFGIDQIINDTHFSDHSAIIIETKTPRIPITECTKKFRNWKKVSTLELGERFNQPNWDGIDDDINLDGALEYFVTKVNGVLEDLILERTIKVKICKSQPWFSEKFKTSKKFI